MKRTASALLFAASLATISRAQAPGTPPRDAAMLQPRGTARIVGRIVAADTGNPLNRARVGVSAPEQRVQRELTTDADGRYEATELPAGRYNLIVSKPGYVTLEYGQSRPFQRGREIDLVSGQSLDGVNFALPRGGVITGRVTDHNGEALPGIQLTALRYAFQPSGRRRLQGAGFGGFTTNDLGEFRIYGLMPGSYVVAAGAMPGMVSGPDQDGLGTTYFPGTASMDEAQSIAVEIGREAVASFSLVPARMVQVSGVVIDSRGRPMGRRMLEVSSQTETMFSARTAGRTETDGSFVIPSLPPGRYSIGVTPMRAAGLVPPEEMEFGSLAVSISGSDVTGLTIATRQGVTVSGRVIFDGSAPRPDGTSFSVSPLAADPLSPSLRVVVGGPDSGRVDATGRFRIAGVFGNVLFQPSSILRDGPWTLKSVTLNGVDITDVGYSVSEDIDGLEVTLTDRQTSLSGLVKDSRGQPADDYAVVIFPNNLRAGALPTRFIRTVRSDQRGRYQTRGLPPGSYFAAAVEFLEQGEHYDPTFQQRIRRTGTALSLKEGQSLALDFNLLP